MRRYAAFSAAVLNEWFKQSSDLKEWKAWPEKGQLYVCGMNVHPYLQSPFFKDHDFVLVENTTTGERFAADPSLYDYTCIETVRLRSEK